MSRAVEIKLMGRTLSIKTNDDPAQITAAAALVQQHIDTLRGLGTAVASDRLMTLVALNLAGELLAACNSEQQQIKELHSTLEEVHSQVQGLVNAPLR
ncbi:MAG: cell division protein ZapA [Mariprofundaceae bacterium]